MNPLHEQLLVVHAIVLEPSSALLCMYSVCLCTCMSYVSLCMSCVCVCICMVVYVNVLRSISLGLDVADQALD